MTGHHRSPAATGRSIGHTGRRLLLALAGVLVVGLTWASAGSGAVADPGVDGPADAGTLRVGVTVLALWRDWDDFPALLREVTATGTDWMRVDVGWCSLEERGPGQVSAWYQERLDTVVAAANEAGLHLLLTLGCTPSWDGGTDYAVLPRHPAQYQRVAKYLAERYAGRVDTWEVWNEPDCIGGCPNGSPEAYVPVLRAGYLGFKAGDPAATVISGGISGNNADWISRMYAAGGGGYFDAVATHPYLDPTTAPPETAAQGNRYRITSVSAVRAVMVANGDAAKSIWFTEFGWSTPQTGDRPGVTEAVQADYLRRTIALVHTQYPYVSHAFWFTLRDRDDSTPYENAFGLLRVDDSRKPSFAAFTAAVRSVGPA